MPLQIQYCDYIAENQNWKFTNYVYAYISRLTLGGCTKFFFKEGKKKISNAMACLQWSWGRRELDYSPQAECEFLFSTVWIREKCSTPGVMDKDTVLSRSVVSSSLRPHEVGAKQRQLPSHCCGRSKLRNVARQTSWENKFFRGKDNDIGQKLYSI